MIKGLFAALSLLVATVSAAHAYSGLQVQDIAWQSQFAGAHSWSYYGVVDDGATDNTTALNSIPGNTPVIADCPDNKPVSFTGTWNWPSGLTVWQKPNCILQSTITTAGVYPISISGGATASAPISNVQYYGLNFQFVTPTSGVRMAQLWVNHLTLKYVNLDGSGGFAFLRGSDQEVGYGLMTNTVTSPGNPGIRHIGNVPLVATSPGRHANVWFHNLNFSSGDATFQTCQPNTSSTTWLYGVSTDGVLYENSYGYSAASAVILVNESQSGSQSYYCRNIKYDHITGAGYWFASVGNSNAETSNITISNSYYDGSGSSNGFPALGIGAWRYGGAIASAPNTFGINVQNVTLSSIYQIGLGVSGSSAVTIDQLTIPLPRVGISSTSATVPITASSAVKITRSAIADGGNAAAIWDGSAAQSIGTIIQNTTISQIKNGNYGILLGNSLGATLTSNPMTPFSGQTTAIGLGLTAGTSGTYNATATGNNVSAMPSGLGVACATGQGNTVVSNAGAADCAP